MPKRCLSLTALFLLAAVALFAQAPPPAKPGFVIHFDFVDNEQELLDLVHVAVRAGAQVINLVPPAHVWENRKAKRMLDSVVREIGRQHLALVFTRIDASYPPDAKGERLYYLFDKILNEPAILPNGQESGGYFLATVGKPGYAEWMEEETRYYARHYGHLPNLLGINLGPFSEPFSAERSGFLEYLPTTNHYEISQYTPYAAAEWRRWLLAHYRTIDAVNREYRTSFATFAAVPMPKNEEDGRFGRADLAYYDLVRMLNDWLMTRYRRCRDIWHRESHRRDVPFILQFDGGMAEKIALGRPAFAAFDLPGWIDTADALGLSLYTNNGFRDFGHASITATVNLMAVARLLGKPVFVLEGGCEAPNVVLDKAELEFYASVARPLAPRTYVYEFIKEKWNEPFPSNPGKLVDRKGQIQQPAFEFLSSLFKSMASASAPEIVPALYVPSLAVAARGHRQAGELNAALIDLASHAVIVFVPRGREAVMRPGVPRLDADRTITPPDPELSRLLSHIPPVYARRAWREAVTKVLLKPKT